MAERVASLFAEIGADTSKLDAGLKETQGGLKSAIGSFTEIASAIGIAEKAAGMLKAGFDATVGATVAYAGEVRGLSQAFSISSEEASTLLQIADDMKVSNGALETAFREMAKNGIAPSVASLAALAERYQAIKDPAERAQFALKNFGRAGLELSPILRLTKQEIAEMGKSAQDAGLIMSGEAVQAARDYEVALDDLSDKAEGFKIRIGSGLIPALNDFASAVSADMEKQDRLSAAWKAGVITLDEYRIANTLSREQQRIFADQIAATNAKVDAYNLSIKAQAEAMQGATSMAVEAAIANSNLSASTSEITENTASSISVYDEATAAMARLNVGEATRLELEEQIALITGRITAEELARRDAVGFLTKQLELGNITTERYLELLARLESGSITAAGAVRLIGDAINNLPTSKNINININERFGPSAGDIGLPGGPSAPVVVPGQEDVMPTPGHGWQHGGSFVVPGSGSGDRMFRVPLEPGEKVTVTPNSNRSGEGLFAGATIVVRDDLDIEMLARKVTQLQRSGR